MLLLVANLKNKTFVFICSKYIFDYFYVEQVQRKRQGCVSIDQQYSFKLGRNADTGNF